MTTGRVGTRARARVRRFKGSLPVVGDAVGVDDAGRAASLWRFTDAAQYQQSYRDHDRPLN